MMARPVQFGTGVNAAELGRGGQAQIIIQPGPHATYQDGDILCAFNRRRIRCVHAEYICHVRHQGFNSDGLRDLDTLPEVFQKETYQYKFERISVTEIRRTNLGTLDEEVIGPTPTLIDGRMQHMAVAEFIMRRKAHARHRIFGTAGAEIWYGGRTNAAWEKLDTIWDEIEARTANVETDFEFWPITPKELERFLIVSTNDFDDAVGVDLTAALVDETDPDDPIMISKRKTWIDWVNLRDLVETDVLDKTLQVDIRGRKHVHQEVTNVRVL